jgi:hypothetical protein
MTLTHHLRAVVGVGVAALTLGLAAHAASADNGGEPQPGPFERHHSPIISAPITPLPPAPPITLPGDVTVVPQAPPLTLPGGVPTVPDGPPLTSPGGLPTNQEENTAEPGPTTGDTNTPPAAAAGSDATVAVDVDTEPQPWIAEAASVDIALAQVKCDGTIHLEFNTVASPDPGWTANHVVMFDAVSSPAELHAVESTGHPANGAFVFEQPGTATETYRVLVVALFDPDNTDGAKAIDEAETVPAPSC